MPPEVREVKTEEQEEEDAGKVVVEDLEAEMAGVEDFRAVFEVEDHRKVSEAAEAGELMTVHGVEAAKVAEVEAEKAGLAIKNPPKETQKKLPRNSTNPFFGFF
jgi:hypothetical protein